MTASIVAPAAAGPAGFGHSLLLQDGDLVLDGGRLVEVAGLANLMQALTVRVLTPAGTDRFNTRYGLSVATVFGGANGLRMTKDLLRLELVRTIATDPRVSQVLGVLFDDDPDYLARHPGSEAATAAAHYRRTWLVEVDVQTVAGDVATLLANVEV